ncbi:MAG TPA: hypothetical protein VF076_07150 [Acidimicrobiales bacterium]
MIDQTFLEKIGVFQAEDGSYLRHRVKSRNFQFDPTDPDAERKGLLVAYDEELIPFPVVLPLATDPDSIAEAQARARLKGADFYHPRWGWLRWGVKREQEHEENLGSDAVRYERRRVVLTGADEAPEPTGAKKGT